MKWDTYLSPAKINLGLEVHHRRPSDGYHYITSIFIPISYGDKISFRVNENPSSPLISRNHLSGKARDDFELVSERGNREKNILIKGLSLLQPFLQGNNIEIDLEKNIPTGAGLGGGSSNAGLLLRYAADRFKIPHDTLLKIALELGADVPFFLSDGAAIVSGIGDIISPIEIGNGFGVLCLPETPINTKLAYSKLKRTLQPGAPPRTLSVLSVSLQSALIGSRWKELGLLENHFEGPVFQMHPELNSVKESFYGFGADYASLSGSGSALYALVEDESRQSRILMSMRERFPSYAFHPIRFPASLRQGESMV